MIDNLTSSQLTIISHLIFKQRENNQHLFCMGPDHPEQLDLDEILRKLRTMTNEAVDCENA